MKGIHPSPAAGIIPAMKLKADGSGALSFPRTEAASSPELRANFLTLNDVLDELYFNRVYRAGDGVLGAGAGAVVANPGSNLILGVPTVEFPATAGGQPAWRVVERVLPRWASSGIRLTIEYSAVAGSANSFILVARLRRFKAGDVMPTAMDLNVNLTLPGPAVAQTVMEFVYVDNTVFPGDRPWVVLNFLRDKTNAADTNANSLHILSVRLEILPL